LEARRRIPLATYRLQLGRQFGFDDARGVIPYLFDLGIDSVYASPIFRARPGSKHGYDIVDPNELNPDLGTAEDFGLLIHTARKYDMGWIQDIVPNHMAFHHDNFMLMDILKMGRMSPYHGCFDIDWEHPAIFPPGAVMAPFLERPYAEGLERGDFRLHLGETGLYVTYKRHAFPLGIEHYESALGPGGSEPDQSPGTESGIARLLRAARALKMVAGYPRLGRDRRVNEEIATVWRLYSEDQAVREFVDGRLGSIGKEEINAILSRQRFALACWKDTADLINYRRFFDVNGLIALRAGRADVLRLTQELVTRLVREGAITGLRIDHVDGLRDPEACFSWLREHVGRVYTVAEKILTGGEQLRWLGIDGTTGYDFLNAVNGLFCMRENKGHFDRIYREFTGFDDDPRALLYEKKKLVMDTNLRADVDNLARWLRETLESPERRGAGVDSVSEGNEDIPETGRLREALVEMMAELPVYRTYLSLTDQSWHDGTVIAGALGRAEGRNPHLQSELRLLASVLMAAPRLAGGPSGCGENIEFTMTLQQYTGAVMAKGFEDTFLYVYNRLISLNEVGGDPAAFGSGLEDFHAFNLARSAAHPHSMSATSTHDTKRGEDARARINVLSEIPDEWEERVKRWHEINLPRKLQRGGEEIPDCNDEYALYQALIGSYPFEPVDLAGYRFRISRYVRKAAREAKVHTRWRDPDDTYESGFASFAESILTPSEDSRFLDDFLPFQRRVAHYGALNSLSQTLIKICAPGVPDFYQGSELWDLSLVDPDNRHPVDYARRARMLEEIMRRFPVDPVAFIGECLENVGGGMAKMLLVHNALAARKANPYVFREGTYTELTASGKLAGHVVAFARSKQRAYAICIVPRFVTGVVGECGFPLGPDVWGDTVVTMPPGAPHRWQDAVSGMRIAGAGAINVGDALRLFPVSLLMEDRK
jgi:(1->4)-alpha-D-glucan 1-alpha-D-glucosylmutase